MFLALLLLSLYRLCSSFTEYELDVLPPIEEEDNRGVVVASQFLVDVDDNERNLSRALVNDLAIVVGVRGNPFVVG